MATLEQKLDVALWWKQMRETNNAHFLPLLFDKHRFLVLKGGGGSGKSIFAGRKILERVTNEPGHRYLVVRKVAKTLRESCFEQLKKQANEYYADQIAFIPKGKGSDMYIRFKTAARSCSQVLTTRRSSNPSSTSRASGSRRRASWRKRTSTSSTFDSARSSPSTSR